MRTVLYALVLFGSGPIWAAPKDSPWGKDYFPNVELTDQDGKKYRFYDDLIKDKVVAVNFIYTHCGDSCPAETASLKQVYKLIENRMGRDIYFLSISIDPQHDTPRVLKEYAERFRIGKGWLFLTGAKNDTILIRKKFALYREEIEKGNVKEHNINFIIGNEKTGQWMKKTPFDEPKSLAWLLSYTLPETKIKPDVPHLSYAEAKQLPNLSNAEDIFRFRCSSCHSLGEENGLGPGLAGVTRIREPGWLRRWLKTPDTMLANKDPIALELFNRYNKVIMPNLKLSDSEVEALIDYMDSVAPPKAHRLP